MFQKSIESIMKTLIKRLKTPVPRPSDNEWFEMRKKPDGHCEDWYLFWPLSGVLMFLQRLFGKKGGIWY